MKQQEPHILAQLALASLIVFNFWALSVIL